MKISMKRHRDVLDQASLFVAAVEKYLRDQPILYSLR